MVERLPEVDSPRAVRVLTEVVGIDKEFDYRPPAGVRLEVGAEVRVDLAGRRVGGWVTATGVRPEASVRLRDIARVRGFGPTEDVVGLASWAAWRWAGRRASLLSTASAHRAVRQLPPPRLTPPQPPPVAFPSSLADALQMPGQATVVRLPPAADPTALVAGLAQDGPTLVVVASAWRASALATRLSRAGGDVALLPAGWAQARAGAAIVVGSRSAIWAPCPGLTTIVVVDGHDESLCQEQAPTWNAVAVAVERASRCGARCVVITPCPTPDLAALGEIVTFDRAEERRGWARVEVLDRRGDDPRLGLYSERLARLLRPGSSRSGHHEEVGSPQTRVLVVLNRTGRARLLSCTACGEIVRCERCGAVVAESGSGLRCSKCGSERPRMCAYCDSTKLKTLRVGVTRAREELQALSGREVGEVTATTRELPGSELVIGTEAALRRYHPRDGFGSVAFVDFDQELLAPRVRAPEEAMALLALASRLVGGRKGRVLVQTRLPTHPVLRSAVMADPSTLLGDELELRRSLRMPPFSSVAVVSGPDAGSFVAEVDGLASSEIEVSGPDSGRWLLKSPDPSSLADSLARVERGGRRVRVAVDPARF